MNTEEILRAAADRLDALAQGTTPGPWRAAEGDVAGLSGEHVLVHNGQPMGCRDIAAITGRVDDVDVAEAQATAAWIAALSPALAGPLALLMRTVAQLTGGFASVVHDRSPLADIARLILGQPVPASEVPAAVRALDALDVSDPERAHGEAEAILLAAAAPEVRDAYRRTAERAAWWVTA